MSHKKAWKLTMTAAYGRVASTPSLLKMIVKTGVKAKAIR